MASIVNFNITGGVPPFKVNLLGSSDIPEQTFTTLGKHSISNVPNGIYTLRIVDDNDCVFENEVTVNPSVTTTTTTVINDDVIVIGQSQDTLLIFNEVGTNKNNDYVGYPDSDIVTLYLWFRTLDGKPLTSNKTIKYNISAINDSEFKFEDVSDQIHCEVTEDVAGPSVNINGSIYLKTGFIESFFEYTYYRGSTSKRFVVDLRSVGNEIYPKLETRDDAGTTYGIVSNTVNQVVLNY